MMVRSLCFLFDAPAPRATARLESVLAAAATAQLATVEHCANLDPISPVPLSQRLLVGLSRMQWQILAARHGSRMYLVVEVLVVLRVACEPAPVLAKLTKWRFSRGHRLLGYPLLGQF